VWELGVFLEGIDLQAGRRRKRSRGLAEEFWSVLKKEWIDTGQFGE